MRTHLDLQPADVAALLANDQFRPVPGFPRYMVGRDGRVLSSAHRKGAEVTWREIKRVVAPNGYERISLGRAREAHVHEVVAAAFIGPRQAGMQIRHLDGCPTNNSVDNLVYGTPKQNGGDKIAHGRSLRGRRQHLNKLTEKQVLEIRHLAKTRELPQRTIARQFGIAQTTVRDIMTRKSWGWLA